MARGKVSPLFDVPMMPMSVECVECLEDNGLWYYAQRVRHGEPVYEYEVRAAIEGGLQMNRPGTGPVGQLVLPPIVNSAHTNSLAAMMSEGYPPNTGRHYEDV